MSDTWSAQAGQDPGMWARLMGYVNPIQPAAADTLNRAPNPLNNPSPVDPRLAGGGPPVPQSLMQGPGPDYARQRALADAQAQLRGGSPQNINTPPTLGPVSPIQHAAQIPVNLPPAGGTIPIGGGPGNTMESPTGPQNIPIGGGPGNTMESPTGTPRVATPVKPKTSGQPIVRKRSTIPASATASVPAAGGSPFTMVNRPNMGPAPIYDQRGNPVGAPVGGALARGGGPPLMSALDLSRLFGRQ